MKIFIVGLFCVFISHIDCLDVNAKHLGEKLHIHIKNHHQTEQDYLDAMLFVVIIERRKKDSSSYEEFCVATMLNSKFGVTLFSCAKEIENYGFWDKLINKISFKKRKFVVRAKHFANSDVSSKHHISNVSLPQDSFDNNMRKYGIIKLRNKLKIEGLVPIKLRQATFKEEVTIGTHKLTSTGKIIVEQTKLETITHKKCASYSKTQYISNYEICCVQPDYSQFTKLIYPGSPLIHNKMLIGITYGYSGKSKRQYIVSFLIGLFDDKIKEMISDQ